MHKYNTVWIFRQVRHVFHPYPGNFRDKGALSSRLCGGGANMV